MAASINLELRLPFQLLTVAVCMFASGSARSNDVDFESDVLPILQEHCHRCHGPEMQESNYRLDVRDLALATADFGEPPIVKGDKQASPLFRYISGLDDDGIVMPPDDGEAKLTSAETSIIGNWIDQGAIWPDELAGSPESSPTTDHWSFQPLQNLDVPSREGGWGSIGSVQTSIDAFIARRLDAEGLQLSPVADRVTWIRRIYLDMHGLPPTSDQVAAFVGDRAPNAFARVIDDVLSSQNYGQRWARHWLDVARFGESTGFEVNRDRENAYYFRDYVIEALNSDKSYRDFVIDQLAGDVAGDEIGTGFLVGGPYDLVKSPNVDLTLMQRQDELADYVNTVATAFLGLTVGCARCHNHKFDPILQKDYYAMQAVFAGVVHEERRLRSRAPAHVVDELEDVQRNLTSLQADLGRLKELAASNPDDGNEVQRLPAVNAKLNVDEFEPTEAKFVRFTVTATNDVEPCLDELEVFDAVDGRNVALSQSGAIATASGTLPGYDIHQLEHINDGKFGNSRSWISNTPGGGWVQIELPDTTLINKIQWGRDRIGGSADRLTTKYVVEVATEPDQWTRVASSDRREPRRGSREQREAFVDILPQPEAEQARSLLSQAKTLRDRANSLRNQIPMAYVGTFKRPEVIHRLHRGDPMSPREPVVADALSVIGTLGLSNDTSESQRRVALAEWIASPANPLTARVIVNRVWQHHFGTGLVSTPSDLGKNGTRPSHPELLDWMATQFMEHDWSLKWLHREILSSHIYQQSSRPDPKAVAVDAESRLLWRFPPRRLEAEAIRDCVLQVAGALNFKAGGPGFLLFEVDHENVHHYFPKQKYGAEEFRRMIYMTKIRQEQDDVFGVFDCPDGGQVIPSRSRSTTPLQALNLFNSEFMLQQAGLFAERVRQRAGEDLDQQVEHAFQLAFSRSPDEAERELSTQLVRQHGLVALCRAIFNTNEFLFLS